jgi:hypothetical protein
MAGAAKHLLTAFFLFLSFIQLGLLFSQKGFRNFAWGLSSPKKKSAVADGGPPIQLFVRQYQVIASRPFG